MTDVRVGFDSLVHKKLTKKKNELKLTWEEVIIRGLEDGN